MIVPAVMLIIVLLLTGACSDEAKKTKGNNPPKGKTEVVEETTSPPTTVLETTGEPSPPEVTLGADPRGEPEVLIRLEGAPETTFSGLCSVGEQREVLSGRVPKRFAFDLKGRRLSCRIEKQDGGNGDLKVLLIAGETTKSVQQTNTPGSIINVSYAGE
jgi:hypothetical protein